MSYFACQENETNLTENDYSIELRKTDVNYFIYSSEHQDFINGVKSDFNSRNGQGFNDLFTQEYGEPHWDLAVFPLEYDISPQVVLPVIKENHSLFHSQS